MGNRISRSSIARRYESNLLWQRLRVAIPSEGREMSQGSTTRAGRPRMKFTPANIQKSKDWMAQGIRREDIAKFLDVTLGSLHAWGLVCEIITMQRASASRAARLFPKIEYMSDTCNGSRIVLRSFSWSYRGRIRSRRLIFPSVLANLGGWDLKRQCRTYRNPI
jgi:hypothetical protein